MLSVSSPTTVAATDLEMSSRTHFKSSRNRKGVVSTRKYKRPLAEKKKVNFHDPSSVKVAVRIRPLLPFEEGNQDCMDVYLTENDTHHQGQLLKSLSGESNSTFGTQTTTQGNDTVSGHSISPSPSLVSYNSLQVREAKGQSFTFDNVFPSRTEQVEIYEQSVMPLVTSCIEGYNATILAYGQTGSGKTHTILGQNTGQIDDVEGTRSNEGVIPRGLRQLFNDLNSIKSKFTRAQSPSLEYPSINHTGTVDSKVSRRSSSHHSRKNDPYEYQVKIQFLELYGEEIRDLLGSTDDDPSDIPRSKPSLRRTVSSPVVISSYKSSKPTITLRDSRNGEDAEVLGALTLKVSSADEALEYLRKGLSKRVVGKTAMNAVSSRSHVVFTAIVQQTWRKQSNEKMEVEMKTSKIHFVDLSGSERIKRSNTKGKSLKEGIDINKGLLVLGKVISALTSKNGENGKVFVPYRDSKLTRLLKGSLGGNHKTLMIACVSPSSSNTNESISTLRYANRAKYIENKAKINVDPAAQVVTELKSQVAALAAELLKVKNNQQRDDASDDCPFSLTFLNGLVSGDTINTKSEWKKDMSVLQGLEPIQQQRPKTEPVNVSFSNEESLVTDSWEQSNRDVIEVSDEDKNDITDEDPDLDKNMVSYDFALAKLRESLDEAQNRNSELEYDRCNTPGLGKIQNIDELYNYLNHSKNSESKDDLNQIDLESPSTEDNDAISDHMKKLDQTITYHSALLLEMSNCHERYDALIADCRNEMQMIKTELEQNEEGKKKLANVVNLVEEDSQCSASMIRMMGENDYKLRQLERKHHELNLLKQVASQNNDEIQKLEQTIQFIKQQKAKMEQIRNIEDRDLAKFDYDEEFNEESNQIAKSSSKPYSYILPQAATSFKRTGNSENIEEPEMKESFPFLPESLTNNERKKLRSLTNEIAELKQKLLENEKHRSEGKNKGNEKKDTDESKLQVPKTLTLNPNHADLSLLDCPSSIPLSLVVSRDGEKMSSGDGTNLRKIQKDYTLVSHALRTENKKQTISPLHQITFENITRDNKLSNQKAPLHSQRLENKYFTSIGQKPSLYYDRKEPNDHMNFCGGKSLVQLFRSIFGKQKDPIVRQW